MENFQKIDFSLESPEMSNFYYTDKGYLKFDRFTCSFYDSENSTVNVKTWFKPLKSFNDISRVMIQHLCENHHPHVSIIVTPTGAELLEGKKSTGKVLEFLKD